MHFLLATLALVVAEIPTAHPVLIPVAVRAAPGANGSIWTSHLTISNISDHTIQVMGVEPCEIGTCLPSEIAAMSSFETCSFGTVVYVVDDNEIANVRFLLRVQEISRQSDTWGTAIPTVAERDATRFPTRVQLLDIPAGDDFRTMLRVFDFHPGASRTVIIRAFDILPSSCYAPELPDPLLFELEKTFIPDENFPDFAPPHVVLPISDLVQASLGHRVRVEIEPVSNDLTFWAFVSVTNNATQHVTAIAP